MATGHGSLGAASPSYRLSLRTTASRCGGIVPSLAHLMDLHKPVWDVGDTVIAKYGKVSGFLNGTHILHGKHGW
jgi:hypothetical protein